MDLESASWNRRQLLKALSLIALHAPLSRAGSGVEDAAPRTTAGAPRLLALRLWCAAPLDEMGAFYHDKLGLPILEEGAGSLTIGGGDTRITFVAAGPGAGEPFYHFAFNIPENKILLARRWQLERTPTIPPGENLRDPDLPADVVDYRHWNAHSIFFWDPAGNLVEYIARHDLANPAPGPFTPGDILYASEIGLIVDDVDTTAADLKRTFELEQYRRGGENFRAIGDECGLLLAMKRGRMLGFGEARPADVFPTTARLRGGPASYRQAGLPYEIVAG